MLGTRINLHGARNDRLIDLFGSQPNRSNRRKDFFDETKNDPIPLFRMTFASRFKTSGANDRMVLS